MRSEYQREYYLRNREKKIQYQREYRNKNLEKARAAERASQKIRRGNMTVEELEKIKKYNRWYYYNVRKVHRDEQRKHKRDQQ